MFAHEIPLLMSMAILAEHRLPLLILFIILGKDTHKNLRQRIESVSSSRRAMFISFAAQQKAD